MTDSDPFMSPEIWGEDKELFEQYKQARREERRPPLEWVLSADVRIGDKLAFLLSDAQAFCEVTGWDDGQYSAAVPGQPRYRHFRVKSAPWWVETADLRHSLETDGKALIVRREAGA